MFVGAAGDEREDKTMQMSLGFQVSDAVNLQAAVLRIADKRNTSSLDQEQMKISFKM